MCGMISHLLFGLSLQAGLISCSLIRISNASSSLFRETELSLELRDRIDVFSVKNQLASQMTLEVFPQLELKDRAKGPQNGK
jgi:hypothetical protein